MALDHFVVGIDDLERGRRWASDTLGITLEEGGSHAGRGTRNALAGLGNGVYLEVLARDPHQSTDTVFPLPTDEPRLLRWALRSDDLPRVNRIAADLGLTSDGISDWQRETPGGEMLRWQILLLSGASDTGGAEGASDRRGFDPSLLLPFFIDWQSTTPPGESLPAQARYVAFHIDGRMATTVSRLLTTIGEAVAVTSDEHAAPGMALTLDAADGRRGTIRS